MEQGILLVEVYSERIGVTRRSLNIFSHYARPDIFRLHVDGQPRSPVESQ